MPEAPAGPLLTDADAIKMMERLEQLERGQDELKTENVALKARAQADDDKDKPVIITNKPIIPREVEEAFLGTLDAAGFPKGSIRPATEFFMVDTRRFRLHVFGGKVETNVRPAIPELNLDFIQFVGAGADQWDRGFVCRCDLATHHEINVTAEDIENSELRLLPGMQIRTDGHWSLAEALAKVNVLRRGTVNLWTGEKYRVFIAGLIVDKWNRQKREEQAKEVLSRFDKVEAKTLSNPELVKAFAK